ncbi:hypothetical protein L207DRAFT_512471 [Hyaloscypha variabilis F]|uniref:Uncharacterized protein n=1 Tax=Hyaloscypha variabilis (strain UAMH 11265 / GT02V1 / F) TaxID=1149755 RepID=A0A2J6RLK2_HYAVF|nr:hypothetical protein L207DRAFT_512471 [Hyaloscypha variabilis F]
MPDDDPQRLPNRSYYTALPSTAPTHSPPLTFHSVAHPKNDLPHQLNDTAATTLDLQLNASPKEREEISCRACRLYATSR